MIVRQAFLPIIFKFFSRIPVLFKILLIIIALPAYGESFNQCVNRLQVEAQQQGIQEGLIEAHFSTVKLDEDIIALDRNQPEFTSTFADYLGRRVTTSRVEKGRQLYQKHRALLKRITRETGVPGQYLVAFWGLETNYGGYMGEKSTLSALTTLACDPRRSAFFSQQLFAALNLMDRESIPAEQMRGSWAGAVGHVQFMPSVYLTYARDGDGDHRRDLWNSIEDALYSAATYLRAIEWETGYRWGREVILPEKFPYQYAGLDSSRTLSEWNKLGITDSYGQSLSSLPMQASLVVPSGHKGPAFLVYNNFKVIMGWNRSEFYALSVGHLADRIAGAGQLSKLPPLDKLRLSRTMIKQLQDKLNQNGYAAGKPDGIFGPASRRALRQFQHSKGLIADGYISSQVLAMLAIPTSDAPANVVGKAN